MLSERARAASARATCPTRPAGAVLHTAAGATFIGYEGAPHGIVHCDVVGCRLDASGSCQHAIRAELNAVLRVARSDDTSVGATLEVTEPLHPEVVGMIINAGVSSVVCKGPVARVVQRTLALAKISLEVREDASTGERGPKGMEQDVEAVGRSGRGGASGSW